MLIIHDPDVPVPFALTPMALALLAADPVYTCPARGRMTTSPDPCPCGGGRSSLATA